MKSILLIFLIASLIRIHCAGQSRDPLYVIKVKGKKDIFYNGSNIMLSTIKTSSIKSMEILKDSIAYTKYGYRAKNGVVTITLTDSARLISLKTLLKEHNINSRNRKLPIYVDNIQQPTNTYFDPDGIKSVTVDTDEYHNKYINIITLATGKL